MNVQVLTRPVFCINGCDRNVFVSEQGHQVFTGCPPDGENSGCRSAQMGDGASDINATAARLKYRGSTAEFPFGIDLWSDRCAIERGRKRQRIDTYHRYLLLGYVQSGTE